MLRGFTLLASGFVDTKSRDVTVVTDVGSVVFAFSSNNRCGSSPIVKLCNL